MVSPLLSIGTLKQSNSIKTKFMPRSTRDTTRKSVPLKKETVEKIALQIERDRDSSFVDMDEGRFLASILELVMNHEFLQSVNDRSPKEIPFISKLKRLLDSSGLQQVAAIAQQLQQEDIVYLLEDVITYGLPRLIEDLRAEYPTEMQPLSSSSPKTQPKTQKGRNSSKSTPGDAAAAPSASQNDPKSPGKQKNRPLEVVAVIKKSSSSQEKSAKEPVVEK